MADQCDVEVRFPLQVVVEGTHDAGVLEALCSRLGMSEIDVQPIGGKTRIRENLAVLAKEPKVIDMAAAGVLALGVVRDADDDADAAFTSVRDALIFAGFPAPKTPEDGAIGQLTVDGVAIGEVRVSVMILPGAGVQGCLESLCVGAMAGHAKAECVEQFFACLESLGEPPPGNRASPAKMAKAHVHAYLSTMPDPDLPVGFAALKGYWPLDHPAFDPLKQFLKQLAT